MTGKNVIVEPRLLAESFIPKTFREVAVIKASDGRMAFAVNPHELLILATYGMVSGKVHKGVLRYAILTGEVGPALRILRSEAPKSGQVTKKVQQKGARRWVQRFDMARGGVIGGSGRLWFRQCE